MMLAFFAKKWHNKEKHVAGICLPVKRERNQIYEEPACNRIGFWRTV